MSGENTRIPKKTQSSEEDSTPFKIEYPNDESEEQARS
jgi:hypothetical protein